MPEPLAARFRRVAAACAARPAIRAAGTDLTYAALDDASDRVAALIAPAAGPHHVGVLLPHDATAIVALLGAVKAGAVVVPLDVAWPARHRAALLADAAVHTVLTDAAGAAALGDWAGRVVRVDAPLAPAAAPTLTAHPDDPAALYYSSGSTGEPKGILLAHRSLVAEADHYTRALAIGADDRLAWLSPLAAGAAKLPILSALLTGATVLPYAVAERGVAGLGSWLEAEGVTVLSAVATLFRRFMESLPEGRRCPALRAVKLGGEPVLARDAEAFARRFPDAALWNGLGISEAGGNVCFYRWDGTTPAGPTLPLGRAVPGVTLTVEDDAGRPLPAGSAGEIVVRAPHLALGYWGRPELTAARFRGGAYRTGDVGVLAADGCLTGLGRLDDAVKIRGHRVDPAAVESALRALPAVADAAAAARRGKLVAFVVPARADASPTDWRAALAATLPAHLVPQHFVVVEALPRLPNGKLDRRALVARPLPERDDAGYAAPRDALERQLAHVWAKALRLERVGVTDDFFELGGDSLDAVRICAMLEQWLRVNLPLTELARCRTIAALAAAIRARDAGAAALPLVLLNAGETPPFFCVPGAGSDAFALLELARALGPAQTFYAIQHPGLDGAPPRHLSVEAMAARCLPDLLAVQPRGPYYLGGTSFGGLVAYELARQLRARGETVALLALIETYGHGYPPVRLRSLPRAFPQLALRWLLPIGKKGEPTWAHVKLGIGDHVVRWRARRALARRDPAVPRLAHRFVYLQEVCFEAHRRYAFPPYDGPIVVFRAEQQPPARLYALSDDLGWAPVARGGLVSEEIPGYHGAHIHAPHVRGLATALGARLAAARGDADPFDALAPRSRALWEQLGPWWDEQIGDDGHAGMRARVLPAIDRLLAAQPGERVLDAGCGNGWYGRRLARAGVAVVGFDFSGALIDRARSRAAAAGLPIDYHVLDATDPAALRALGDAGFDAAVCLMAFMDMTRVTPLLDALARSVRAGGRVVWSIVHPGVGRLADAPVSEPLTGIGLPGQPVQHFYFHRPLPALLEAAARVGLVLDAREDHAGEDGDAYLVGRWRVSPPLPAAAASR